MAAAPASDALGEVLASREADYLGANEGLARAARKAMVALWEEARAAQASKKRRRKNASKFLSGKTTLHVEGFDAEQIWAQLDVQVPLLISNAERMCDRILKADDSESDLNESDEDEDVDILGGEGPASSDLGEDEEGSEDEEGLEEGEEEEPLEPEPNEDNAELLPTEEGFFRLGQMEDFVRQAEENFEQQQGNSMLITGDSYAHSR